MRSEFDSSLLHRPNLIPGQHSISRDFRLKQARQFRDAPLALNARHRPKNFPDRRSCGISVSCGFQRHRVDSLILTTALQMTGPQSDMR